MHTKIKNEALGLMSTELTHFRRLTDLAVGALLPPAGRGRIIIALLFGIIVHTIFGAAVFSMMYGMFFGMSKSLGQISWPLALITNTVLIVQFPLVHSLLLSRRGDRFLANLIPGPHGATLKTTSYAIIASAQLLALFTLWTPTGIVWWHAEGMVLWAITSAYIASWILLMKASFDAGAEVQSGALGWMSLMANKSPIFPDMPTTGLFRIIRQPIYVSFALTLWTVPVWTPDQLILAITFTVYCLLAPVLKEKRFSDRYGVRFVRYREIVPYALPRLCRYKVNSDR